MFERYTEKARRVIFFARYEASQFGSHEIDTEHLLLGLIREDKSLLRWIPKLNAEDIRQKIDAVSLKQASIPTSVDLPLSKTAQRVLRGAGDEADQLAHRHIGTEHLLLGLLAEPDTLAAQLLRKAGADPAVIRLKLAEQHALHQPEPAAEAQVRGHRQLSDTVVEIHGIRRKIDRIRDVVSMIRLHDWHWHKTSWKPWDILVNRKTGQVSFEMKLAEGGSDFELIKNGWKKDHCFICRWELFDSEDEHGAGYTNGRIWLCAECCERFILKDFFGSSNPEIT